MVEMRKDPLSGDRTNYREYVRFRSTIYQNPLRAFFQEYPLS